MSDQNEETNNPNVPPAPPAPAPLRSIAEGFQVDDNANKENE